VFIVLGIRPAAEGGEAYISLLCEVKPAYIAFHLNIIFDAIINGSFS
jgi:hypothetical protein